MALLRKRVSKPHKHTSARYHGSMRFGALVDLLPNKMIPHRRLFVMIFIELYPRNDDDKKYCRRFLLWVGTPVSVLWSPKRCGSDFAKLPSFPVALSPTFSFLLTFFWPFSFRCISPILASHASMGVALGTLPRVLLSQTRGEKKLPGVWLRSIWVDGHPRRQKRRNTTCAHVPTRESARHIQSGAKRTAPRFERSRKVDVAIQKNGCTGSKGQDPPELSVQGIQGSRPPHQTKQTVEESGRENAGESSTPILLNIWFIDDPLVDVICE